MLISADKSVNIQNILEDWLGPIKLASSVRVQIDIDPYSFLRLLALYTMANCQKIVNFPVQIACLSGMAMIATTLNNLSGCRSLSVVCVLKKSVFSRRGVNQ